VHAAKGHAAHGLAAVMQQPLRGQAGRSWGQKRAMREQLLMAAGSRASTGPADHQHHLDRRVRRAWPGQRAATGGAQGYWYRLQCVRISKYNI